jgi:hypothetical protein
VPMSAVVSGANRTSCAFSVQCDRVPATSARSPRATMFGAIHAFWVNVTGLQVGMLFSGVVAVWDTVAMLLVTVTVTVRLVFAIWTVTVCAAGVGVSRAAAVVGLPASSVADGSMLPETIACCAALVLAVMALMPAVVAETFWNCVLPDSSHRCIEPLADCRIRNFFVARTTMPRCTASTLPRWLVWLNCRAWVSPASAV